MSSCNISENDMNTIDSTGIVSKYPNLVECSGNTTKFNTFKPYAEPLLQEYQGRNSGYGFVSNDATCCYIVNKSDDSDMTLCSDFSFNRTTPIENVKLRQVNKPMIISNKTQYDGSFISICAVPPHETASLDGPSSGLKTSTTDIKQQEKAEGGIKGLVLLVIAAILSMLAYILFIFGPFMFWTKFAPNIEIRGKNNCNNRRSIIDRFFGYSEKYVPYDWKQYENCRPPRESSIVLDKCMGEDNMTAFHDKLKMQGSDKWSNVEYFIKGFPYNLIQPKTEKWLADYLGMPLLGGTIVLCITIFYAISGFNPSNAGGGILASGLTGVGFGLILLLVGIYHLKTIGKALWIVPSIIAFLITGGMLVSSGINEDDDLIKKILGLVISIIIFIAMSILSTRKTEDDKKYGFGEAMLKALYYIRRCFVTGYRESSKSNHWTINKILRFFGKMTFIPNWVWVIFGAFLIPLVTFITMGSGWIAGTWKGFVGFYDFVGDKQLSQQEVSYAGGSNADYSPPIRGGVSRLEKFTDQIQSEAKKRGESIGKSYTKTPVRFMRNTIAIILFVIPLVFGLLYGILNTVFSSLLYHFMPLLYPNIMGNIISCNIKALIFKFGFGLMASIWGYHAAGTDFVPYEALIWMTVTFFVVSIYNIFTK